jgi:hypothetical protein
MVYLNLEDGIQMKFKVASVLAAIGVLAMTACSSSPMGQAYWQRVEDNSALYMTGPKGQQELEENIALCVHVIDEMVELDALRGTMPPDTHSDYHRALNASGDLAYYDTPTRLGDKKVAHSDFHDFESCMRSKGWERVRYVRYQTDQQSHHIYRETKQYRETGLTGAAAIAKEKLIMEDLRAVNAGTNQ